MANTTGKKFGGRTKGTPNKVKSKTKEFLNNLIDDNQEKIAEELNRLKGRDYLAAVDRIMEYTQPKLSRTEVKADVVVQKRKIGFKDE